MGLAPTKEFLPPTYEIGAVAAEPIRRMEPEKGLAPLVGILSREFTKLVLSLLSHTGVTAAFAADFTYGFNFIASFTAAHNWFNSAEHQSVGTISRPLKSRPIRASIPSLVETISLASSSRGP